MTANITAGRIVGALILAQIVGGVASNFVLSAPLFEPPGFLENAAPNSLRIASSALLALGLGGITVVIAAIMFPAIWKRSQALAVLFAALSAASMAVGALEQINVMSMVSLSQAYNQLPVADRGPFQALRGMVAASRNWSHYVNLIVVGCTLLVMYSALLRHALIPKLLAGVGVIAAALQVLAVATPLFGGRVNFVLLAPLGLTQLVVAIWLLRNGFRNPQTLEGA